MSKMLEATCAAGIVTAEGVPVPAAEILSEGVGSSEGVVLIDGDKARYLAKTSPDLKTTLGKIADALTQIATALTVIDAKPVGGVGSAPVPGAAAAIAQITAIGAEVSVLKETLK